MLAPLQPSVRSMLQDYVLALIDSISPSSLHAATFWLRRIICVENIGFKDVKAGQDFEKQAIAMPAGDCEHVIKLIEVWLAALDICRDDAVAARIAKHCVRRLEQSTASSPSVEPLWLQRVQLLVKMNMSEAASEAASHATTALPMSLSLWELRFSILSSFSEISVALLELAAVSCRSSRLTKLLVQQMRDNESRQFQNKCTEETAVKLQSLALHLLQVQRMNRL